MIVTRKHLPRRTFLKGMGAVDRAAGARRDDAGVRRAGRLRKAPLRLALHLRAERHHDGRLDAEGRRRRRSSTRAS